MKNHLVKILIAVIVILLAVLIAFYFATHKKLTETNSISLGSDSTSISDTNVPIVNNSKLVTTSSVIKQTMPTPVDICSNIEGVQTSVPAGMADVEGTCVTQEEISSTPSSQQDEFDTELIYKEPGEYSATNPYEFEFVVIGDDWQKADFTVTRGSTFIKKVTIYSKAALQHGLPSTGKTISNKYRDGFSQPGHYFIFAQVSGGEYVSGKSISEEYTIIVPSSMN